MTRRYRATHLDANRALLTLPERRLAAWCERQPEGRWDMADCL